MELSLKERAKHTAYAKLYYLLTPGRSCYELMTHFPSPPYFSSSLCIETLRSQKLFTSPLQTMTILFSLSCSFFAQCFWCVSSCWLQPSPTNAHNWWWCKSLLPLLAPTITRYICCLLAWDFPRAPAAERIADWLRHVWWFSQVCHKGGWRTETVCGNLLTLWRSHDFLLNLTIPSTTRIIVSKLPAWSFIIYLNIAWSVAFFLSVIDHSPSFAEGMEGKEFISQDTSF